MIKRLGMVALLAIFSLASFVAMVLNSAREVTALDGDPILIETCNDLNLISDNLAGDYKLANDIDCSGVTFTGIGPTFTGTFDGQNYSIDSLDVSGSGVGLFQATNGATINNLTISSGTMESLGSSGSIVGVADNTTLVNVHSALTISGEGTYKGGLVGRADNGLIIDSSSYTGTLTASTYSGGLVGLIYDNNLNLISNSYFNGSLNIVRRTIPSDGAGSGNGGLVGLLYGGEITNSYSAGVINLANGTSYSGGLVGLTYDGVFNNLFSASTITSISGVYIGAGFGAFYSTGEYTSVGTNIHYDSYLADLDCAGFSQGNLECTAQNSGNSSPSYFKNNSTRPVFNTWDFSTIWVKRIGGYPTLRASTPIADLNGDGIIDVDQPNIGGYTSILTNKIVAIDVGEGCELTTDDMTTEANLNNQDSAYDYNNGLWDFEADCGASGSTTTIKLYYYDVNKSGLVLRKYNPNTSTFSTINDTVFSDLTIDSHNVTVVTYQVIDGGELDMDGLENGQIVDPAGIASPTDATGNINGATLASTGSSITTLSVIGVLLMFCGLGLKRFQLGQ